jgi:ankyrin repeat protein
LILLVVLLIRVRIAWIARAGIPRPSEPVQGAAVIVLLGILLYLEAQPGCRQLLLRRAVRRGDVDCAAAAGHVELVELLVENGAPLEEQDPRWGTALICAVGHHQLRAAERLLARGAAPNTWSRTGITPMLSAIYWSDTESVEILLRWGADVAPPEGSAVPGPAPLLAAAWIGAVEKARVLLAHGAPINQAYGALGVTALEYAAVNNQFEMARYLLSKGADPTMSDHRAVMSAAHFGHREVLALLLATGVDVNTRDGDGDTALGLARKNGHRDVVRFLQQRGATDGPSDASGD